MVLKPGITVELDVETLAFGGKGIGKLKTEIGDFTFFIPNVLPGQRVLAKIIKKKKQYAECKLLNVISRSSKEIEIPYQEIPGAPYAKLPLPEQKNHKKETVFHQLKTIGKINDVENFFDEYIDSPNTWHYRNKMEYSFSSHIFDLENNLEAEGFGLGFKKRGQWKRVENLNKDSGLFDEIFENNLYQLRHFFEKTNLPAWNPLNNSGYFRFLVVKKSFYTNTLLFHLITTSTGNKNFPMDKFIAELKTVTNNRVEGVIHTQYDDLGDRTIVVGPNSKLVYGNDHLREKINNLIFKIGIQSFFQTNPNCAEKLYDKVLEYAIESLKDPNGYLLDLFCGTGTIAQLLAQKFTNSKVIGVDIVDEAIKDAIENSNLNKLKNVKFFTEDAGKFLRNNPEYQNKISCTVIDPPRAGLSKKTLSKVLSLNSSTLIYVSCNPATLSRDLELIQEQYNLKKLSIVDQFPHTSHVECVALFEKR